MKNFIKYYCAISMVVMTSMGAFAQSVGINASGTSPDASAILDVSSTTKGLLIPRVALVSGTNPIASPVEGLLVYNNGGSIGPDGFYFFDGTVWKPLASGSSNNNRYVGEVYSGGIIFFVDSTGEHGLMASLDDLDGGSGVEWSNAHSDSSGAYSMTNGIANTDSIIQNTTTSAALTCRNHTGGGHSNWYLPSNRELVLLFANDVIIDKVLDNDGNSNTNGLIQGYNPNLSVSLYWSSTDDGTTNAWLFDSSTDNANAYLKNNVARVRAIRAF